MEPYPHIFPSQEFDRSYRKLGQKMYHHSIALKKEDLTKALKNSTTKMLTWTCSTRAEKLETLGKVLDVNIHIHKHNVTSVLDTITVTIQAVESAIKRLLPTKSPGPDNIHPMLITQTKDVIKPISTIFLPSFRNRYTSVIYHRSGRQLTPPRSSRRDQKQTDDANYRPIYKPYICTM